MICPHCNNDTVKQGESTCSFCGMDVAVGRKRVTEHEQKAGGRKTALENEAYNPPPGGGGYKPPGQENRPRRKTAHEGSQPSGGGGQGGGGAGYEAPGAGGYRPYTPSPGGGGGPAAGGGQGGGNAPSQPAAGRRRKKGTQVGVDWDPDRPVGEAAPASRSSQDQDRQRSPSPGPIRRGGGRVVGWLVTYNWDRQGEVFELYEGRNIIARDPDPEVGQYFIPNDDTVSNPHMMVLYRNGRGFVKDLDSVNGTFLNDDELLPQESVALHDGAVIRCGQTTLLVRLLDMKLVEEMWPGGLKSG